HPHRHGELFHQRRRAADARQEGPGAAGPALFQIDEEIIGLPMSEWQRTRRHFLKAAAGITAGTALTNRSSWAQDGHPGAGVTAWADASLTRIDSKFMITPDQAWDWNVLKAEGGPTYAGSAGWKRFMDFLIGKMPEFGAIDLDYVEIP